MADQGSDRREAMLPVAVRGVNGARRGVPDVEAAVRWYTATLGAEKVWGLGTTVGLLVATNFVCVGEPADGQGTEPVPIQVFVDDPDTFVAHARAGGADDSVEPIGDWTAPWGLHRKGGFVDVFGLRWVVSDLSPLSWHGPGRTHHLGYIEAVIDRLDSLAIPTGPITDDSTDLPVGRANVAAGDDPKRAASFFLDDVLVWGRFPWADCAALGWDEEFGWVVEITHEPGSMRGREYVRYALDLGLSPDPLDVARHIQTMLNVIDLTPPPSPRRYRRASEPDPDLEASLARCLTRPQEHDETAGACGSSGDRVGGCGDSKPTIEIRRTD
jgi:catechol 2,3-dioxygenase-like lactoylglutathione lyase family enzyme